jgi:hypothetical protein
VTPDQIADGLSRLGRLAHVWVEGDHGSWCVKIGWGAAGIFVGRGETVSEAYRAALDAIVRTKQAYPGLHDLAASVTPGILGLPAKCRACQTMKEWVEGQAAHIAASEAE